MSKMKMGGIVLLAMFSALVMVPADAGFFSTRFDDFKELVQAGKTEEAAALYAKETAYFSGLKGDKRQFVDTVLGQRDQRQQAELAAARERLMLADREQGRMLRWKKLKEGLGVTQAALARAEQLPARGEMTNAGLGQLEGDRDRISAALHAEAPQALLEYGLFTEPLFQTQYPVQVRWADFTTLPARLYQELGKGDAVQLAAFNTAYGDTLIPALNLSGKLSELYVAARIREAGARSYLARHLLRERLAREGWKPPAKAGSGVLLVAWPAPRSAVSSYRIAPPTVVDFKAITAAQTPGGFIASGSVGEHELVVFLRPAPIQVQRTESDSRQLGSQYQASTRRVENPAYASAAQALDEALDDLEQIKRAAANASSDSDSTLGILSMVVGAASEAAAESSVRSARRTLESTPRVIEEAVLAPYTYAAKTVAVRQWVPIHYAVYDPGTGKVTTGTTERGYQKRFSVVEQVRADDPNRAGILAAAKTPQDVEQWIGGELSDKYDDIWATVLAAYKKQGLGL